MTKPATTPTRMGRAQAVLAVVIVVGFFAVLITTFVISATPENGLRDARLMMVGALIAALSAVIGYFFGSTSTSQQKNELLANSIQAPNPQVSTVIQTNDPTTVTMQETPR